MKRVIALAAICFISVAANGFFQFQNFVKVTPFADGNYWLSLEPLHYDILNTGVTIEVPAGFVTDFASVPRLLWSTLPRWGKYGPPAIVHDYLYWDQSCTRKQADRAMVLAMHESNVSSITRFLVYSALRTGGKLSWEQNSKSRKGGWSRIVPFDWELDDPTVRWEDLQLQLKHAGNLPVVTENIPTYCTKIDRLWDDKYN